MSKNPCYDTETRTDCPKRHGGCQLDCSEWDEYVKKRNTEYDKKFTQNEFNYAIYECRSNYILKKLKQKNNR